MACENVTNHYCFQCLTQNQYRFWVHNRYIRHLAQQNCVTASQSNGCFQCTVTLPKICHTPQLDRPLSRRRMSVVLSAPASSTFDGFTGIPSTTTEVGINFVTSVQSVEGRAYSPPRPQERAFAATAYSQFQFISHGNRICVYFIHGAEIEIYECSYTEQEHGL